MLCVCPVMNWEPVQGVFLPLTSARWNPTPHHPELDRWLDGFVSAGYLVNRSVQKRSVLIGIPFLMLFFLCESEFTDFV